MERYKKEFVEKKDLKEKTLQQLFGNSNKNQNLNIEFLTAGAGLYNVTFTINNKVRLIGIFNEDNINKLEKAIQLIYSSFEKTEGYSR